MSHDFTDGSEQLMSEPQWRGYVCKSLDTGEKRMTRMEESIHANTTATHKTAALVEEHKEQTKKLIEDHTGKTKELIELFTAMKGGFQVIGWIGNGLKWITITAGSAATFWKIITGRWPFV